MEPLDQPSEPCDSAQELTPWSKPLVSGEGDEQAQWYVLRTRSRHESKVCEVIAGRGAWYFLPQYDVVRKYQHRRVRRRLPMFPGYVFMHGDLDSLYAADRSPHTAGFLMVPDQAELHRELREINEALAVEAECEPHPWLQAGVRVRVASGPFEGLRGKVDQRLRRPERLVMQVGILGQATGLEIDADLLEPEEDEIVM